MPGYSASGGTCISLFNSGSNCGSLGNQCSTSILHGTSTCVLGTCEVTCASGYDYDTINNVCVATGSDTGNCGQCGNTCFAPVNAKATCTSGTCSWTCNSGYTMNGQTCISTGNDPYKWVLILYMSGFKRLADMSMTVAEGQA